jgi:hypothetical protein
MLQESVLPVLVTVPFSGENASADRAALLGQLTDQMQDSPEGGSGFYGQLQYHAFETTTPVTGMQLYETLQREVNLFPEYIENQRNHNNKLVTRNPVKDFERMAHLPPPLPYDVMAEEGDTDPKTEEDAGELEWDDIRRLAIVADDPNKHDNYREKKYFPEARDTFMTVVIIEVDEYDLTKEEKDNDDGHRPHAGHNCAAKLFGQTPQWCNERGIQAMRIMAQDVLTKLANIETGNMWFYELAEQAEGDMDGTEHDDSPPWPTNYRTTTCMK